MIKLVLRRLTTESSWTLTYLAMSQIACINLNIKEVLFLPQFSDEEPPPLLTNELKSTIFSRGRKNEKEGTVHLNACQY